MIRAQGNFKQENKILILITRFTVFQKNFYNFYLNVLVVVMLKLRIMHESLTDFKQLVDN